MRPEVPVKKYIYTILGIKVYLRIGAYLGVIPFFKGMYYYGLYYSTCGMMYTPTRSIWGFFQTIRPNLFIPHGSHLMETYGLSFITYPMICMGISADKATKLGFFVIYTLAFLSLALLFYKITNNSFLALVYIILFFLQPMLRNAARMEPPVFLGILALPVSSLLDYRMFYLLRREKGADTATVIREIMVCFLIRMYVVSFSWYISVIAACMSCGFFLLDILFEYIHSSFLKKLKEYIIYVIAPWFCSLFILLLVTPRETSTFSESIEFFNSSSLDLATLFVPSKEQLIADYLPYLPSETPLYNTVSNNLLSYNIIPENFYKSGTGSAYYLGYAVIISVIIGVAATKRKWIKAMLVTFLVFLTVSLGPGLKILTLSDMSELMDYGRYYLPLDKDIFVFPWRGIYNIIPFSSMRAVARWLYGGIIPLLIMSAAGVRYTAKKSGLKSFIIAVFAVVSILEYYPGIRKPVEEYEQMYGNMLADSASEIEPLVNKENARLVFCNYDFNTNTYMIPPIMSVLDKSVTYAGAGDKSRDIAEKYQPECVIRCQRSADPDEIVASISSIKEEGLAEYILLPHFDLRDGVYGWPEDDSVILHASEIANEVEKKLQGTYDVIETTHYTIVCIAE